MQTFSSSINKAGSNKRLALKAPSRRIIRNVNTQNSASHDNDIAPHNPSQPGTPDPQIVQDSAHSTRPTQQDPLQEEGSACGSTADIQSAKGGRLEGFDESNIISVLPPAARALKAPTVISTATPRGPSASDIEPETLDASYDKVAKGLHPTEPSIPSGRGRSRTEIKIGSASHANELSTSTSAVASTLPRKRHEDNQEVQPAAIDESAFVGTDGTAANRVLGPDTSNVLNKRATAKKRVRSNVRIPSTTNHGELPQPQCLDGHVLQTPDSASTRTVPGRKRKQKKSAQEVAEEVIAEATGRNDGHREQSSGRKRKRRPELVLDEGHEIVPAAVKMIDLVKDRGLGKTSKREAEMQKIDWDEVKRKRRKAEEEALQEAQKLKEARKNGRPLPPPGPHVAERLVLVNGQMVIDESSRFIDRNAATARDADQLGEAISEDHLTKRVNQATVGRKPGTVRTYSTWDDEETGRFYQGLRMFGTDFMMISKMFPGTSRAIIKKKYTKEEKLNPEKVFTALNSKEPIDLQAFSEMTDTVYEDPKQFYKELAEEQARLEAEDARMRAEDGQAEEGIHESIEQGNEDGGTEGESSQGELSAKKNRFAAEARAIVDGIGTRKKKSKKTPSAKKKEGKRGKGLLAEGTEEIVGRIEDVAP